MALNETEEITLKWVACRRCDRIHLAGAPHMPELAKILGQRHAILWHQSFFPYLAICADGRDMITAEGEIRERLKTDAKSLDFLVKNLYDR